jgi:hypothetical protein
VTGDHPCLLKRGLVQTNSRGRLTLLPSLLQKIPIFRQLAQQGTLISAMYSAGPALERLRGVEEEEMVSRVSAEIAEREAALMGEAPPRDLE